MYHFAMIRRQRSRNFNRMRALFIAHLPDTKRMVALFDHQTRKSGKIVELLRRPMLRQKFRRGAQNTVISRQLAGNQVRRDIIPDTNIKIDALIHHIHQTIFHIEPQF